MEFADVKEGQEYRLLADRMFEGFHESGHELFIDVRKGSSVHVAHKFETIHARGQSSEWAGCIVQAYHAATDQHLTCIIGAHLLAEIEEQQ